MHTRTVILLTLFLAACGSSGGSETLIGAPCETFEECDVSGGMCVTDGQDGMCVQACISPGGAGQCPVGNYCTRSEFSTDRSGEASMTLCFPACKQQRDCRDGYQCQGVSSGPGKVCVP